MTNQWTAVEQYFTVVPFVIQFYPVCNFQKFRLCGLIVRVRVVPRRTVVGDIDRRFDNLSGSHHQSHVNCVSSVYGIYVSGQLRFTFWSVYALRFLRFKNLSV